MESDGVDFRAILLADIAVELGVLSAEQAGAALIQRTDVLAACPAAERPRVEAEYERLVAEAAGDPRRALAQHGVNRAMSMSMGPQGSQAIADAGARIRAPLRTLDADRYVGFSPLGEGGMGVVYLALDTEMNRRVAFKMIRDDKGADPLDATPKTFPEDLEGRFLQEAWVTGGLEHPGIVPVYELGRAPSGAPFYTMRLVRGERTLGDAIDQVSGLEGRLALLEPFLRVCDAIRYAHSRGVIHRDLKPDNIALGPFGEVVVLDWGLAKVRDRPGAAASRWQERIETLLSESNLSAFGSAIGTPGYMAPEAARAESDLVDARSDVFSLGAILYRILTGKLPHPLTNLSDYIERVAQGVTEVPGAPAGLAAICIRALAGSPDDRYAGVDEMAEAIRAWQRESEIDREVDALRKEAEAALETAAAMEGDALLRQLDRTVALASRMRELKPDHEAAASLLERARAHRDKAIDGRERQARSRLLKRVGVVGLLAATAATVVVAVLLNARRREAEDARRRAEAERARAEGLSDFMLYDLREGLVPVGKVDLLATVARKSLAYYESLPTDDVDDDTWHGRARALLNIGIVFRTMGDVDAARKSTTDAQTILERLVAADPDRDGWQRTLADVYGAQGLIARETGDLDAVLASQRRSIEILRRLPNARLGLSNMLMTAGQAHQLKGDLAGALESYDGALAIQRELARAAPGDPDVAEAMARSLDGRGSICWQQGDLASARKAYDEALAILRELSADRPDHTDWQLLRARGLNRVSDIAMRTGDLDTALRHSREALALYRSLVNRDPANMDWQKYLISGMQRLGEVEAIAGGAEISGVRRAGAADSGGVAAALARYRESLVLVRELAGRDPSNSEWQRTLSTTLDIIGDMEMELGDIDAAEKSYAESLAIARHLAASDPANKLWQRDVTVTLEHVGNVQMERGDLAAAEKSYGEVLAIRKRLAQADPTNGEFQRDLMVAYLKLAFAAKARGDRKLVLARFQEAAEIARKQHAALPDRVEWQREHAGSLVNLAYALAETGRFDDALETMRTAERIAAEVPERMRGGLPDFARQLRTLQLMAGRLEPETATDHLDLATRRNAVGEYAAAARHMKKALADEQIRGDLMAGHLFNAACYAALAAETEAENAETWRKQALEWLGEDLRRRRAMLEKIEAALKTDVAPQRRAQLGQMRTVLRVHIENAHKNERALQSLRGSAEFEALFGK